MAMPPLSAEQTAIVRHGELVDDDAPVSFVVHYAERENAYAVPRHEDEDTLRTLAGYCEVIHNPATGHWFAHRETMGGSSGSCALPSRDAALSYLAHEVRRTRAFWQGYADMAAAGDVTPKGQRIIRCDGEHYVVQPDLHPRDRDLAGFGGHRWEFILDSGQHLVTHNLWRQGVIPTEMRDVMPDNARRAVTFGPAETRAAHKARKGYTWSSGSAPGEVVEEPTADEVAAYRRTWGAQ